MYKANCDIVVDRIVGKIGLGTVIRNSKGEVMASCAQSITANLSLKSAKLVAVWKSITFSRDYGLNPCAFELDEACVVKWIEKGGHRESVHGRILDDIDSIVDDIGEVVFCHSDRGANKVARGLANFALKSNDGTFWMEDFPNCVRILVEADRPTLAASIEQSRNKASRHETKGPGTIPSSSNQENQSGKSSGTGRSSENNSNDHDGSLRLMIALMPVLNKETRNLKGEAVGLLVDSESKLRSPVSGQSDGTKQQTNV
ncbi:hypothetical protein LWI29_032768 [Acer saccharum]|uniref:RNase H type-1 domain-containing protein n=1 Tax=Acer saccharum TaxID=4024 RepID=A0AA39S0I3_ACESA|nr:hypothetical protein LWI29_032768 [Acer saccharum]